MSKNIPFVQTPLQWLFQEFSKVILNTESLLYSTHKCKYTTSQQHITTKNYFNRTHISTHVHTHTQYIHACMYTQYIHVRMHTQYTHVHMHTQYIHACMHTQYIQQFNSLACIKAASAFLTLASTLTITQDNNNILNNTVVNIQGIL